MSELKERIKDFFGNYYYKWIFKKLEPEYSGPEEGNILVLPPSDLDGSFGDELMVKSFVANFSGRSDVTIFTDHLIRRDDFLSRFPKVKYKNGFQVRNYKRWAEELKKASSVYIIGADALDGIYSTRHSLRFLRLAQMAHKMNKPVAFSGFSISLKITEKAKEALGDVGKFSTLKARDLSSYERLSQFVSKDHLLQVSDMAFLCPFNEKNEQTKDFEAFKAWADQEHGSNRKIIAFCPNSIQAENLGWVKYVEKVRDLLNTFEEHANVSILYLYHDTRPLHQEKSDLDISKELYDYHSLTDNTHIYFTDNIENGIAIKSYLKYIDFTITGRMHFGISGLADGKPMFGISYANKFEGMLRLFDIDPTVSLVDYTDMEKGKSIVQNFLNDYENQIIAIKNNIEKIKQLSYLNGKDVHDVQ